MNENQQIIFSNWLEIISFLNKIIKKNPCCSKKDEIKEEIIWGNYFK